MEDFDHTRFLVVSISLSALFTWIATLFFIRFANARQFLDYPNHRSSHTKPIPKGGGLVFMTVILIGWLLIENYFAPIGISSIVLLASLIALLSFVDDVAPLDALFRLVVQALICGFTTLTIVESHMVFQLDIPVWLDRVAVFFALLWFTNLYNFMDGIDGLAGAEAIFICIGLVAIGVVSGWQFQIHTGIIFGAMCAFMVFNWQPAKVFMGDVGSIGLGYLLGYLLLQTAIEGYLAAALIIPMYFVFDASMMLIIRLFRGYQLFIPHRTHSFQHAVDSGWSHAATVLTTMVLNILLLILALLSVHYPFSSFASALVLTSLLWWRLRKLGVNQANSTPKSE